MRYKEIISDLEAAVTISPIKVVLRDAGYLAYFNLWIVLFAIAPLFGGALDFFVECSISPYVASPCFLVGLIVSLFVLFLVELGLRFSGEKGLFLRINLKEAQIDAFFQNKLSQIMNEKGFSVTHDLYQYYQDFNKNKFSKLYFSFDKKVSLSLAIAGISLYIALCGINMTGISSPNEVYRLKQSMYGNIIWIVFGYVLLKYFVYMAADLVRFKYGYVQYKTLLRFLENNLNVKNDSSNPPS